MNFLFRDFCFVHTDLHTPQQGGGACVEKTRPRGREYKGHVSSTGRAFKRTSTLISSKVKMQGRRVMTVVVEGGRGEVGAGPLERSVALQTLFFESFSPLLVSSS